MIIGAQSETNTPFDIREIDQYEAFRKIVGYTPQLGKFYKSIFRSDNKPGCRYAMHNGILYFTDNAGYNGKLSFNIVEVVKEMYGVSFAEAITILRNYDIKPMFSTKKKKFKPHKVEIKIEALPWSNCSFIDKTKISIPYLESQNVFLVKNYWCNTKNDSRMKKNRFYNPVNQETIAYYFPDTDHVKLYWHDIKHSGIKFYGNIEANDIYGENRYHEYDGDTLFIVKSGKDDLVVNYHLGLNSLGVQTETMNFTKKFIGLCKPFENIYLWYDNDKTGQRYSDERLEMLRKALPKNNVHSITIPSNKSGVKDPADIIEKGWNLNEILNNSLIFKK